MIAHPVCAVALVVAVYLAGCAVWVGIEAFCDWLEMR